MRLINVMDRKSFEKFATEHRPTAAEVARRIVGDNDAAEDIAQDVFLKLWNIRESLDHYRSPGSLVAVMARNMAIDATRRQLTAVTTLDAATGIESGLSPEEQMIDRENSEAVDRILAALPDGQQSVLRMRHIDGMETAEIAATIGSTEVAVRVALSRARQRIKDLFIKEQKYNNI